MLLTLKKPVEESLPLCQSSVILAPSCWLQGKLTDRMGRLRKIAVSLCRMSYGIIPAKVALGTWPKWCDEIHKQGGMTYCNELSNVWEFE